MMSSCNPEDPSAKHEMHKALAEALATNHRLETEIATLKEAPRENLKQQADLEKEVARLKNELAKADARHKAELEKAVARLKSELAETTAKFNQALAARRQEPAVATNRPAKVPATPVTPARPQPPPEPVKPRPKNYIPLDKPVMGPGSR